MKYSLGVKERFLLNLMRANILNRIILSSDFCVVLIGVQPYSIKLDLLISIIQSSAPEIQALLVKPINHYHLLLEENCDKIVAVGLVLNDLGLNK